MALHGTVSPPPGSDEAIIICSTLGNPMLNRCTRIGSPQSTYRLDLRLTGPDEGDRRLIARRLHAPHSGTSDGYTGEAEVRIPGFTGEALELNLAWPGVTTPEEALQTVVGYYGFALRLGVHYAGPVTDEPLNLTMSGARAFGAWAGSGGRKALMQELDARVLR